MPFVVEILANQHKWPFDFSFVPVASPEHVFICQFNFQHQKETRKHLSHVAPSSKMRSSALSGSHPPLYLLPDRLRRSSNEPNASAGKIHFVVVAVRLEWMNGGPCVSVSAHGSPCLFFEYSMISQDIHVYSWAYREIYGNRWLWAATPTQNRIGIR